MCPCHRRDPFSLRKCQSILFLLLTLSTNITDPKHWGSIKYLTNMNCWFLFESTPMTTLSAKQQSLWVTRMLCCGQLCGTQPVFQDFFFISKILFIRFFTLRSDFFLVFWDFVVVVFQDFFFVSSIFLFFERHFYLTFDNNFTCF